MAIEKAIKSLLWHLARLSSLDSVNHLFGADRGFNLNGSNISTNELVGRRYHSVLHFIHSYGAG